ncbi:MAG: bifunctional riboflavin kinase/FAD synthetase [Oscillospiraceae bacterium]
MEVFAENQNNIKLHNTAVALGVFDAMHIGHVSIIKKMIEYAIENSLTSCVYMFENLPRGVISGSDIKNVCTIDKRLELLKNLGVEVVIVEKFTTEYQKMEYTEFIKKYLIDRFDAKFICVGYNYHFGYMGKGNPENLAEYCRKYGIKVDVESCMGLEETVSSTYIRELIANGDVGTAEKYLGRKFSIAGNVAHGNAIGKSIGFPTANINLPPGNIIPKFGVYVGETKVGDKWYPSITNIGGKPTVENDYQCIETHILNFDDDIYGDKIEIRISKFLREITKFKNLEALKLQLEKDKKFALENSEVKNERNS